MKLTNAQATAIGIAASAVVGTLTGIAAERFGWDEAFRGSTRLPGVFVTGAGALVSGIWIDLALAIPAGRAATIYPAMTAVVSHLAGYALTGDYLEVRANRTMSQPIADTLVGSAERSRHSSLAAGASVRGAVPNTR